MHESSVIDVPAYWHRVWAERIQSPKVVKMNGPKADYLLDLLWQRRHLINMPKLEVGCGTGIHVTALRSVYPRWGKDYTGLDLAASAVAWGASHGLDLRCVDVLEFTPDKSYGLFLFLDCLEHIEQLDAVAARVKAWAWDKPYYVFGNVPLYRSAHETDGGFEQQMDIDVVKKFVANCGCDKLWFHVYGIGGFPYLVFEGFGRMRADDSVHHALAE